MTKVRLPAKLTRPRLYGAADRVRLFEALEGWRERPLIWVEGPPGAGKTTLVSTYLGQLRAPTLWYRLDEDDADAATFFSFLAQGARSVSRRRRLALPALTPEYLLDLPAFTRRYFRLLFEALPEGSAVVLDAYEAVSGSAIDALLSLAVAETPPGMRVLVTSREAPPAGLVHLETKGQLGVVSWEALRLSEAEAAEIAGGTGAGEVEALRRYADGWAAGFVVVLDHVRRSGREVLEAAGPVRESLFAYFVNEMFAQADEGLRGLLLRTALLPGFTAAQAQALCPGTDAPGLLERLYRRHYFLDRSTGTEAVYRYHALFQDFLQAQGRALLGEAERSELLSRAGELLEAAGRKQDALDLYTQGQRWTEAERLICALAAGMLGEGRNAALAKAIEALPPAVIEGSAWLQYWLGSARMLFDPPAGRTLLETAYAQFDAAGDHTGCVLACAGLCELYYLSWSDLHPYREWAHKLDFHLQKHGPVSAPDMEIRVLCALSLYLFVCSDRDSERLDRWNARAVQLALELPETTARLAVASSVSFSLIAQGQWQTLHRIVSAMADHTDRLGMPPAYWSILWQIMLCYMHHQQGDYRESETALQQGAAIADQCGLRVVDVQLEGNAAMAALNGRDLAGAARHVQRMESMLDRRRTLDAAHYDQLSSLLMVAQGNACRGLELSRAAVAKADACGSPFLRILCSVGHASALIDIGGFDDALDVAEAIRVYGESTRFRALEHAGLLLGAGALHGLGRVGEARVRLRAALRLGRECGLAMMFPTAPERFLQQMFDLALTEGIEPDYVGELIRKLKIPPPLHAGEHWPWPVRIFTLGRFRIDIEGMGIEHGRKAPKRPLALLKFLIARRGGARVEQVIDALWPDEEGDAASNALDASLHRLRRLLCNPGAIALHDGHLSLDRRTIWVDALAFDELLEPSDAGCGPDADRILRLYRGHFLASEPSEAWSVSMRERLRSRFVRAVSERGRALHAAGRFEAAAAHYVRGMEVDDQVEAFYLGLMRCHLALQRWRDGVSVYERLCRVLRAGTGLKPTAAVERMYEALLTKRQE